MVRPKPCVYIISRPYQDFRGKYTYTLCKLMVSEMYLSLIRVECLNSSNMYVTKFVCMHYWDWSETSVSSCCMYK